MMKKQEGVYFIPCKVNGLSLDFIFDTGASEVSISATEALFMIKNGYLKKEDIGEKIYYQIADGSISEGQKILLREIDISGLKLTNIEASYSYTLQAPLLLGQSAIEKLGPIQINGNQLTILNGTKKEYDFSNDKNFLPNESYAFGVLIGTNLKSQGFSSEMINVNVLAKGVIDALEGKSEMDLNTAQQLFQQEAGKAQEAAKVLANVENKKFLEANAKKPGVKTTASGLQYEIIRNAYGRKPLLSDKVKAHYHGTLINGTVFDSSVDRGEPMSFPLSGVIQGWQEGLQMMPKGSKFRLFIPASLAYSDRTVGKIPANSVLIFEIELLGINE